VETLYERLKIKEHKIYVKALKNLTDKSSQGSIVTIVDGGGRAHAIAKKYLESKKVSQVLAVPGNDLMTLDGIKTFPDIKTTEVKKIIKLARDLKVDLVDVAQDDAIASGLVDELIKAKIKVFGPTKKASQIEWDKSFARKFMRQFKLPIPTYRVFKSQKLATAHLNKQKDQEYYIKASGLAAGKGAIYANSRKEAIDAVKEMASFGVSGKTFLVEEKLNGEEFSAFAIVSGKKFEILGYAQDHKTVFDGNLGPNTGGMGAVSTPLAITSDIEKQSEEIIKKTVDALTKLNRPYMGILYLGGIISSGKVKIIEFNARWGDPEAQAILPSIQNDYFSLISLALEAKLSKLRKDKTCRVAVTAASKGYPTLQSKALGKEIRGMSHLLKSKIKIYGAQVKIKDNKYFAGGGRLFYVVGEGKNIDQARRVAYNALSNISIDHGLLHYRKDIGYRDLVRYKRG
jgi:phosphoribosylamine--glycine ligase